MEEHPTLYTERLCLRQLDRSDAPAVCRLAGVREIADMTLSIAHPLDVSMTETWIATKQEEFINKTGITFAVATLDENVVIGTTGLMDIDWLHARAEIGYWIGKPYWNLGLCSEAARAVLDYAFSVLSMNRVQATVLPRNPASCRVLEKLGMHHEGLLRQYVQKNGTFEDLQLFSLLAESWPTVPG